MPIKIENQAHGRLPRLTEERLRKMLEFLPREHVRGIDRVRLVDAISDPRIRTPQQSQLLPGLYHPRQGTQTPWLEISIAALLPSQKPFHKRFLPRLSFHNNLAAVVFSLVAQHYHLTLRHSVKRGQLEPAVRAYTEKYLRAWGERQHGLRTRLLKPLQPTFERWARALQRKATAERKKSARPSS